MAANNISTLGTKQLKQEAKLNIAEAKRQGKTVAADGTISGAIDPTATSYRSLNTLDISLLPAKYVDDTSVDNPAPLQTGRPWT